MPNRNLELVERGALALIQDRMDTLRLEAAIKIGPQYGVKATGQFVDSSTWVGGIRQKSPLFLVDTDSPQWKAGLIQVGPIRDGALVRQMYEYFVPPIIEYASGINRTYLKDTPLKLGYCRDDDRCTITVFLENK
jgi:hypothetical protein